MKILYQQDENVSSSCLSAFGVKNCYFKKLVYTCDSKNITKKIHHHICYEIHIVTNGYQEYEIEGCCYRIQSGSFLLIPPNVPHTLIDSTSNMQKYSITFDKQTDEQRKCFLGELTERMADDIAFILKESQLNKEISVFLIENSILEFIVLASRLNGMKERGARHKQVEHPIVRLAKQYIDDNIKAAPNVAEVSKYCYLSPKQLTRIFKQIEGTSIGEYIKKQRITQIEKLLTDRTLSLKEISVAMNFNNEYYFNAFFKKYSGMPPGEYRKMLGK